MADTKISALPASTTPLAGTEVLPIVQSGATKQVSVANLTAGRAISATELTLSTGNLIIGTSGKGIDFSATPGTGTSELLNDYETGDWTPTIAFGGASVGQSYAIQNGYYTKVGNIVTLTGRVAFIAKGSSTGNATITGFPFTVVNSSSANSAASLRIQAVTSTGQVQSSAVLNTTTAAISQNTSLGVTSNLTDANFSDSSDIMFTITYRAV